jgi:DNA polymerase-3 subunit beta
MSELPLIDPIEPQFNPATTAQVTPPQAMPFSLVMSRSKLLKALSHIQNVVERRNTVPILGNVLLQTEGNKVMMTATDMDLVVSETQEVESASAGSTTIPAHTLYDIVRKLPDNTPVELTIDPATPSQMRIISGNCHFILPCLPASEFPILSHSDYSHHFVLEAKALRKAIDKTRYAISLEETRYYLNGLYLHAAGNVLKVVATDGHRLATQSLDLPTGAAGMPGVIVPRKTINELRKLLDEGEGELHIALSNNKIRFSYAHVVLTSKLIDGAFPDYNQVIPANNKCKLTVDTDALTIAVDRVATIASEKTRGIRMTLGTNQIILSASGSAMGSGSEAIEASYDGEASELGFNARYLLEMLQTIDGNILECWLDNSPFAPILVKDTGDAGTLCIIMPMRG